MRMRGWVLKSVLASLVALAALPATGQTPIQMRPDEAFWNAIRDRDELEPFRLFLEAFPQSPYAAEAKARLEGAGAPASGPSGVSAAGAPEPAPAGLAPPPLLVLPSAPPVVVAAPPRPAVVSDVAVADPFADPASSPEARLLAASFVARLDVLLEHRDLGTYVTGRLPGAAAWLGAGDEIVSLNDMPTHSFEALARAAWKAVQDRRPLQLVVVRNGERTPVQVSSSAQATFGQEMQFVADDAASAIRYFWDDRSAARDPRFFADFALAYPGHERAATARDLAVVLSFQKRQQVDEAQFVSALGVLQAQGLLKDEKAQLPAVPAESVVAAIRAWQQASGAAPTGYIGSAAVAALLAGDLSEAEKERKLFDELLKRGIRVDSIREYAWFAHDRLVGGEWPKGRELYAALRKQLDLPPGGYVDEAFLKALLSAPLDYNLNGSAMQTGIVATARFGDWQMNDPNADWKLCEIYVEAPSVSVTRGYVMPPFGFAPHLSLVRELDYPDTQMMFLLGEMDLFAAEGDIHLTDGKTRVALVRREDGPDIPRFMGPAREPKGQARAVIELLARSSEVFLVGPSMFGGEASVRFSSNGFTRAFRDMSRRCAGGVLDAWLE